MRVLYWKWNSYMYRGVERALAALEIASDTFTYQLKDWEQDENFQKQAAYRIAQQAYDAVFSINYNPMLSDVCQSRGIPYVSWVYDSPLHIRDLGSMKNSCNHTYLFDRGLADRYREEGLNVQYMPLAGDVHSFWDAMQAYKSVERAQIAMVGQLYQTQYAHYMSPLPPQLRGYMEGVIAAQRCVSGGYFAEKLLSDSLMEEANAVYDRASAGRVHVEKRELEYMLAQEMTGRERYQALQLLSARHEVHLYSDNQDTRLQKVLQCGQVDYYTQMPRIFRDSKINLNISLKCIRTGIPLRVFDVLASGGFLITNLQAELGEYFELGQELVVYRDLEELVWLADYYLTHEQERAEIARAGLDRIRRDLSFEDRLRKMFAEI